jgi:hypothetical protein
MTIRSASRPSIVAMLLVLSVSSLVACTKDPLAPSPGPQASAPPAERSCPRVAESTVTGTIADHALDEISGVVVGHRMDGFLWVVEDSGNDASVYALEPSGKVVAGVMVVGATNEDWEDLAWANGRLWVGDIGDNERDRSVIQVYSFPEPSDRSVTSVHATIVRLRYEDGPHDAEAMFVDPRDEHLYVIAKQLTQPRAVRRPGPRGASGRGRRASLGRSRPALDRHRGRPRTRRDRGPQLPGRAGVPLVGRPERRFHAGREVVPRVARVERGHRADPRWQGAVLDQ